MKALVQHAYGPLASSLRLGELPDPDPGPGEVLVRVHYAGINPLDCKLVEGSFKWMSRARPPCGVGFDLAGVVERVGHDVTGFVRGVRVAGLIPAFKRPPGAIAELACVPATTLAPVPAGVTLAQAAALPVIGLTALQMCRIARVSAGRKVLVNGAGGGVGHMAVQIARRLGAQVTATGSAANREFILGLGAEHFVDYRASAPAHWGGPFDAIIDAAAALSRPATRSLLAAGGSCVSTLPQFPALLLDPVLNALGGRRWFALMLKPNRADLDELLQQIESGALRIHIAHEFAYEAAIEALEASRAGGVRGKLVVKVQ